MSVELSIAPTNYIPHTNPENMVFESEEPYILMVEDDPVLEKSCAMRWKNAESI